MTEPELTGDPEADELAQRAVDLTRRHTAMLAQYDQIAAAAMAGETVTRRWARWETARDGLLVELAEVQLCARRASARVRSEIRAEESRGEV